MALDLGLGWVLVAAVCCGPTGAVTALDPTVQFDLVGCGKAAKRFNSEMMQQHITAFATCKIAPEYEPP